MVSVGDIQSQINQLLVNNKSINEQLLSINIRMNLLQAQYEGQSKKIDLILEKLSSMRHWTTAPRIQDTTQNTGPLSQVTFSSI